MNAIPPGEPLRSFQPEFLNLRIAPFATQYHVMSVTLCGKS